MDKQNFKKNEDCYCFHYRMFLRSLHTVANEYTSEFVLNICLLFNPTLLVGNGRKGYIIRIYANC